MSKFILNEEHYSRILDEDGTPYSETNKLSVKDTDVKTVLEFTKKEKLNVWNAVLVADNTLSAEVDLKEHKLYEIIGNSDGITDIEVHYSDVSGGTYYKTGLLIHSEGDFHASINTASQFVKFKNITQRTITMHVLMG